MISFLLSSLNKSQRFVISYLFGGLQASYFSRAAASERASGTRCGLSQCAGAGSAAVMPDRHDATRDSLALI